MHASSLLNKGREFQPLNPETRHRIGAAKCQIEFMTWFDCAAELEESADQISNRQLQVSRAKMNEYLELILLQTCTHCRSNS